MTRERATRAILLALVTGGALAACASPATSLAEPLPASPGLPVPPKDAVRELPPPAERWAIVAGVGAYKPGLSSLHGDEDARAFARALEEHAGFSNDHIVLLAGGDSPSCRPAWPGTPAGKRQSEHSAADCRRGLGVRAEARRLARADLRRWCGHGENAYRSRHHRTRRQPASVGRSRSAVRARWGAGRRIRPRR